MLRHKYHSLYGKEVEVSAARNGLALGCIPYCRGGNKNLTYFETTFSFKSSRCEIQTAKWRSSRMTVNLLIGMSSSALCGFTKRMKELSTTLESLSRKISRH